MRTSRRTSRQVTLWWMVLVSLLVSCGAHVVPDPSGTPPDDPRSGADLGAYFDRPPDFPGYPWTYNGQPVDTRFHMNTISGGAHCSRESVTLMFLPWPPGMKPTSSQGARQYIRDPKRVMPPQNLRGTLDLHATLPADAVATGYRYQVLEIYLSPRDQDDVVYVVAPGAVERWQRSDPMTLCA